MATEPGSLPQFDYLRKRATQDINAQNQQQEEALKRRLATTGALNTGAGLKQQNLQAESAMDRRAQAMEGIGFQEQAERARLDEIQSGRTFAREERLGSQDFSRGERLGSQEFGAGESALGRKFQTSERESGQGFVAQQSKAAQDFAANQAHQDRLIQSAQFKANLDQHTKEFNKTFNFTSDQAKAKNAIDQAMLQMAKDGASADKLTTLLNYGISMAGEDADPDEIAAWTESMKAWAASGGTAPINIPGKQETIVNTGSAKPSLADGQWKPDFNFG